MDESGHDASSRAARNLTRGQLDSILKPVFLSKKRKRLAALADTCIVLFDVMVSGKEEWVELETLTKKCLGEPNAARNEAMRKRLQRATKELLQYFERNKDLQYRLFIEDSVGKGINLNRTNPSYGLRVEGFPATRLLGRGVQEKPPLDSLSVVFLSTRLGMGGYLDADDKRKLLERAEEIDMLGWNLFREWVEEPYFKILQKRLREGLNMRVLLPRAGSQFMQALLQDRSQLGTPDAHDLTKRYQESVKRIKGMKPDSLRFLKNEIVFAGILRFDKIMIITIYSSMYRGSESPALIINRENCWADVQRFFDKHREIFGALWERAGVE